MQLKTIKSKIGNPEYTLFLEKEIELIKKQCNISASETVYVGPEKDTDRIAEIEALPFDLPMPDYTKLVIA